MIIPPGAARAPRTVAATRRRRRLAFSLGQLVVGCPLVMIGLLRGSALLIIGGGFLASWFWIPLSIATRDHPKAKARFGYGLLAASLLVAGGMALAFFRLPEQGYFMMLMVGIVGMLWLIVPMLIGWALAGAAGASLPQTWGRIARPRAVAGLRLSVDADSDPQLVRVVLEIDDPRYLGQPACLEIYRLADVHDTSPVNDLMLLASRELLLDRQRIEVELPAGPIRGLTYRGQRVSVTTFAELQIADGLLSDTKVCTEVPLPQHRLLEPQHDATLLVDPKDAFRLADNLLAIPLHRKAVASLLLAVGAVVVGANSLVGVHDQFAPAGRHVMYAHDDGNGNRESPLMNSLFLSGLAGTGIWLALRRQLRSYTTFRLSPTPPSIGRETVLAIDELVRGRPVVDLEDITVRVIACNLEKGSATRGSGSDSQRIDFSEPIRAVVLFEQHLPLVRRGQPLEASLSGTVRFEPVFDLLHPPVEVSQTHGLVLQWQVQLLHDRFVDHALIAPPCEFPAADFGRAGSGRPAATVGPPARGGGGFSAENPGLPPPLGFRQR